MPLSKARRGQGFICLVLWYECTTVMKKMALRARSNKSTPGLKDEQNKYQGFKGNDEARKWEGI